MPKTITDNLEKYSKWILPNADKSAVDFLPNWEYNKAPLEATEDT
jgi:hypothetical protein